MVDGMDIGEGPAGTLEAGKLKIEVDMMMEVG